MNRSWRLSVNIFVSCLAIFVSLQTSFAMTPKCDLILDTTKQLFSWNDLDYSKAIPPKPGLKYAGPAFGVKEFPFIFQIVRKPYALESKNLLIRPFKESDNAIDFLYEMEDPAFRLLWSHGSLRSSEGHNIWLPAIVVSELILGYSFKGGANESILSESFVIEEKSSGQNAGIIYVQELAETREYRINYGVFKDFRNKGYATESLKSLVQYLLQKKEEMPIVATVSSANPASIAVLTAAGFKRERQDGDSIPVRWRYVYPQEK